MAPRGPPGAQAELEERHGARGQGDGRTDQPGGNEMRCGAAPAESLACPPPGRPLDLPGPPGRARLADGPRRASHQAALTAAPGTTEVTLTRATFKGVALRGVLGAADRALGAGTTERAIAALEGTAERYRVEPLLASSWYDVGVYVELHAALRRVTGRGLELARELGYSASKHDLSGAYAWLAAKLSAKQLVTWGPRLLQIYARGVEFQVVEERDRSRRVLFRIEGADRAIWLDLAGSLEAILDTAGARSPRVRLAEEHGDTAEIEMFWVD